MTKEEAKKIIAIMKTADGGCEYCVYDLVSEFVNEFEEFRSLPEAKDILDNQTK